MPNACMIICYKKLNVRVLYVGNPSLLRVTRLRSEDHNCRPSPYASAHLPRRAIVSRCPNPDTPLTTGEEYLVGHIVRGICSCIMSYQTCEELNCHFTHAQHYARQGTMLHKTCEAPTDKLIELTGYICKC
jgi:hypothetical protein